MAFLRAMTHLVKGITLNTNLYTNKERAESEGCEILPKVEESEFEQSVDSAYGAAPKRQVYKRR